MIKVKLLLGMIFVGDDRISQHCASRRGKTKQHAKLPPQRRWPPGWPTQKQNDPAVKNIIQRGIKRKTPKSVTLLVERAIAPSKPSGQPVKQNGKQRPSVHFHSNKVNGENSDDKTGPADNVGRNADLPEISSGNVDFIIRLCIDFFAKAGLYTDKYLSRGCGTKYLVHFS